VRRWLVPKLLKTEKSAKAVVDFGGKR